LDLFDVVRSCFRRWYIALPLLLLVGWYSYSTYIEVKPVYYSNTVIGFTPPSTRIDTVPEGMGVPRNGLLDVGGASLIANMTALGLRQPAVVDRVAAAGGVPDYISKMFPVPATMPELPLVMIESTAPDPTAASKTLELVVAQSGDTLRSLQQQAGVPDDQMVTPFVVSPPSTPLAATPSRTRATLTIFAAGAGLTVLFTVVVDLLLTRRRSRRQEAALARVQASLVAEPDKPPAEADQPTAGNERSDVDEPNMVDKRQEADSATEGAMDAR